MFQTHPLFSLEQLWNWQLIQLTLVLLRNVFRNQDLGAKLLSVIRAPLASGLLTKRARKSSMPIQHLYLSSH